MEEIKKEELSEVRVELDEKNNPIVPEKTKEEPKYVTIEDLNKINQAINNTREYTNRKQSEILAELAKLRAPQPETPKQEPTEWDKKLQTNWKGTVEELAKAQVQEILKQERETQRAEEERNKSTRLLNDNKLKVLERHKELNDENSDKAQLFKQIMAENPDYLQNPFGPVLVMREMEDRLRESGHVDEPTRRVVEKEVVRQTRANAGAMPKGSTNPTGGKTITLTKEAKEFCDTNNIKYENYGKFAAMTNNKGQVEV